MNYYWEVLALNFILTFRKQYKIDIISDEMNLIVIKIIFLWFIIASG